MGGWGNNVCFLKWKKKNERFIENCLNLLVEVNLLIRNILMEVVFV